MSEISPAEELSAYIMHVVRRRDECRQQVTYDEALIEELLERARAQDIDLMREAADIAAGSPPPVQPQGDTRDEHHAGLKTLYGIDPSPRGNLYPPPKAPTEETP